MTKYCQQLYTQGIQSKQYNCTIYFAKVRLDVIQLYNYTQDNKTMTMMWELSRVLTCKANSMTCHQACYSGMIQHHHTGAASHSRTGGGVGREALHTLALRPVTQHDQHRGGDNHHHGNDYPCDDHGDHNRVLYLDSRGCRLRY